jgi:hypothetical protein
MVLVMIGVTPFPPTGERNWQLAADTGAAAVSMQPLMQAASAGSSLVMNRENGSPEL